MVMLMKICDHPPSLLALIENCVSVRFTSGVPIIVKLSESKNNPFGNSGNIVQLKTCPPELITEIGFVISPLVKV